jgi:hypothetical protein
MPTCNFLALPGGSANFFGVTFGVVAGPLAGGLTGSTGFGGVIGRLGDGRGS